MKLAVIILVVSSAAYSAPFCVMTQFTQQCWYYSAESCAQAARAVDGMCVANPQQQNKPPQYGAAPFCTTNGYLTQCYYYSVAACQQAAATMNGMCIPNN